MAQIVLEEQKGLWIETQLLQQAGLGKRLRVVVRRGRNIKRFPMRSGRQFGIVSMPILT
jgi:hypothetical protein